MHGNLTGEKKNFEKYMSQDKIGLVQKKDPLPSCENKPSFMCVT